jgi:hypothetical protein
MLVFEPESNDEQSDHEEKAPLYFSRKVEVFRNPRDLKAFFIGQ